MLNSIVYLSVNQQKHSGREH